MGGQEEHPAAGTLAAADQADRRAGQEGGGGLGELGQQDGGGVPGPAYGDGDRLAVPAEFLVGGRVSLGVGDGAQCLRGRGGAGPGRFDRAGDVRPERPYRAEVDLAVGDVQTVPLRGKPGPQVICALQQVDLAAVRLATVLTRSSASGSPVRCAVVIY